MCVGSFLHHYIIPSILGFSGTLAPLEASPPQPTGSSPFPQKADDTKVQPTQGGKLKGRCCIIQALLATLLPSLPL